MRKLSTTILLLVLCGLALPTQAQSVRDDVIWARKTTDTITLDGVLDEAAWSQAETKVVEWNVNAGIPGSGWKLEAGWDPDDPTHATFKFLVVGNQLYMGATVLDKSVGGSSNFNRFDGLLMALKDHANEFLPSPPAEYLYSWWHDELTDPQPVGQDPGFIGVWAELPHGAPRTPEQIANWDAVTVVDGLANDDAVDDVGYTIEMRFNLTPMGYDVTQPEGDVLEWNVSIYDTDWFWPIDGLRFTSNRVWWQSPWGNASWYNEVRIMARPDVTISSGPVPNVGWDLIIPKLTSAPVLDGELNDVQWSDPNLYSIDIGWSDEALIATYDATGPYRAGQYQPTVNGGTALVVDPPDANVKLFTEGDFLYIGFDVNDQLVQYHPNIDRWDGFIVTINDRAVQDSDNQLLGRRLSFQVAEDGTASAEDDLLSLVTGGQAQVAVHLNAGTTVDTVGVLDNGYTAEMAIDLKALGYPAGLGDGTLFLGVTLLDGDSFDDPPSDSYGARSWWFRQYEGECCPAFARLAMSPSPVVDGVLHGSTYAFLRPSLNPSPQPQIRYSMPDQNLVTLEVFDVRGRLVLRRPMGLTVAGDSQVPLFAQDRPAAGVYLFRLNIEDPTTGRLRDSLTGKMTLVR